MGTKVALTYATLTMGYLVLKLYGKIENTYGQEYNVEFKTMWRFLEDCFVSWTESRDELNNLHEALNSLHPDIKCTMDCNNERLPFF